MNPTGQDPAMTVKIKGTAHAPYVNRYIDRERQLAVEVRAASLGKWEAVLLDTSEFTFGRHVKAEPIDMGHFNENTADATAAALLA